MGFRVLGLGFGVWGFDAAHMPMVRLRTKGERSRKKKEKRLRLWRRKSRRNGDGSHLSECGDDVSLQAQLSFCLALARGIKQGLLKYRKKTVNCLATAAAARR